MMDGKKGPARMVRDARTTLRRRKVVTLRAWILMVSLSTACRGAPSQSNYARGVEVQEACCENLGGEPRDQCLREVVRVTDPSAEKTATNEQTYRCVVDLFQCDPQTGHETPASAQAQHDCIEELP